MPVKRNLPGTLLKWILPGVMICMILVSAVGYFIDNDPVRTNIFYCPPCGCSGDHVEHLEEGFCNYCRMPLIKGSTGLFGNLSEIMAQQYRASGTHGVLYSRFIYPTLFGGIFFGVLSILFFRRKSIELFLALFILTLSLFGLKFQMYGTGYGLSLSINAAFSPISFLMLLGPLIFFHTRNLIEDNFRFVKREFVHLIPGILVFIYYLVFFILPAETKQNQLHTDFDPYIVILEQYGGIISLIIYMSVSYQKVIQVKKANGDRKKLELSWLSRFYLLTYVLMGVWLTNLTINAVFFELKSATLTYFSLWVTLCLYLYWIGIEVFRNEKVLILKNFNFKKVATSEIDEFKEKVQIIMKEEKPYVDPNLTLKKLAEYFDMKPKQLSGLINSAFQKNFYALINQYRVEEVKKLLLDSRLDHLTIVAISEKAGFNSKSTFNSIFKKEVGMTPKEFKIQST